MGLSCLHSSTWSEGTICTFLDEIGCMVSFLFLIIKGSNLHLFLT